MFADLDPLIALAACAVAGYLLGSIPFGVIATRLGGAGDVRKIGSGNIGATNVLRTGRRDLAAITLVGDGGKGALAVLAAWIAFRGAADLDRDLCVAAGAAFVGHIFPVWLGFRGGKGVATFFGTMLAIDWRVGIAAGATWIGMALVFRISSLAALTAAALTPLYFFALDASTQARLILAVAMAILIYIRHVENIRRLLGGKEPRMGGDKAAPAATPPEAPPAQ